MVFPKDMVVTEMICYKMDFTKKKAHPAKNMKFHSLTWRFSGEISVSRNGQRIVSGPECITFVPKGLSYETEILESGTMMVIHFTTDRDYDTLEPIAFRSDNPKSFENLFLMLKQRYRPGRERDYTCMALLYQILDLIHRELNSAQESTVPARIVQARKYIERNFDQPISVAALAEEAGVSQTYFRIEFKNYLGMSPVAYLKKVRMDNAKIDLQSGFYTVSQVASRCGFDSISYFSAEFHRCTGLTPKEYQNLSEN